jgi:hypothetical protein
VGGFLFLSEIGAWVAATHTREKEVSMSAHNDHELVVAKNFPDRTFASAGLELLKQHNITAIVQSPDMVGGDLAGGCDLYVQRKDLEEARGLLEALFDNM